MQQPVITYVESLQVLIAASLRPLSYSRLFVFIDANVHALFFDEMVKYLPEDHALYIMPEGEQAKNLSSCEAIWQFLYEQEADRRAMAFIIGGGVTSDMAGFAVSVWKRGIRFVLAPSTLLAQVDAAIGGKFGINFLKGKNLLGVFAVPESIVVYSGFLKKLPISELRSGFAEVIKHSLIADRNYWNSLADVSLEMVNWTKIVRRSVEIKQAIVGEDYSESTVRKKLNFGHTVGHVIESMAMICGKNISHGDAIAIGMIIEAALSVKYTGLTENEFAEIKARILKYGFPSVIPFYDAGYCREFLLQDKKNENTKLRLSLLKSIGHGIYDVQLSVDEVIEGIEVYHAANN